MIHNFKYFMEIILNTEEDTFKALKRVTYLQALDIVNESWREFINSESNVIWLEELDKKLRAVNWTVEEFKTTMNGNQYV